MAVRLMERFRSNNAGEVCGFGPETDAQLVAGGKAVWFEPKQDPPPVQVPSPDPPKRKGFLRSKGP